MRFSPLSATETRLDLTLTYLPRSTNLGEAFAALLSGRNGDRVRGELTTASRSLSAMTSEKEPASDAPGDLQTPAEAAL
jgi:hypothetical protein